MVRGWLMTGIVVRGLALGIAAAVSVVVGAAAVDLFVPLPLALRHVLLALAIVTGPCVGVAVVWRDRTVLSLRRVALWLEERMPSIEYRLITALEMGDQRILNGTPSDRWTSIARRRGARVLRVPLAAAVGALLVVFLMPHGAVARIRSPHPGDSLDRPAFGARSAANRLTPLVADVTPPAYSGVRAATFDDPTDIRTLAGSLITFAGRGSADGVAAVAGKDTLLATARDDRWTIVVHVGAEPLGLRLVDRTYQRIVAVEPIADLAPIVTLRTPPHDSVLRTPSGRIPLVADVTDDYGIATSSFEYIVSSGEGETFKFRSGTLGAVRPNGRSVSLSATLSIDELALKPGDVVHVRAVARDGNTVSGPGLGVSETRSLRIARADEYDSVAVDAAAPSEADKSVISERMLILLAESLEKKRASLSRDVLVGESHAIAVDQRRLRRTVGEIVFTRLGGDPSGEEHKDDDTPARAKTMEGMLARADSATNRSIDPIDFEGGESPVLAVNKPLLEAYNAMWDATTELEVGEPARALPHMRAALVAIQKARQAERIYLRGTPPAVVIDVGAARLKGKDKGSSSLRRPLTSADSATQAQSDRFARDIDLVSRNAAAAVDSLLLLRVDALSGAPAFAAALGDAVDALRHHRANDASAALARARRALAGAPAARDSLSRWSVVP
jgi:hypothetical protein